MMKSLDRIVSLKILQAFALLGWLMGADGRAAAVENQAPSAKITANSEYSADYAARFVADGVVPVAGGQDDTGRAWCVVGQDYRENGELVFEWSEPRTVAEVVYYGRTAWYLTECWKNAAIYLDDDKTPVWSGELAARHGAQRMPLGAPRECRRLTIRLTASHGGPNPGASEVVILDRAVSDGELKKMVKTGQRGILDRMPWVDRVEIAALRDLIDRLERSHAESPRPYTEAMDHRRRLDKLAARREAQDDADGTIDEELARLQREVLLFDVDRILVIKRHEIVASHVYTYHYEGFKAGGGLYVMSLKDPEALPFLLADSPEGQILDCDLSYDGERVLFSRRERESDVYQVWSVAIDGTDLRRLTDGAWHSYNACWLPDGGIAFLSARKPAYAYCWDAPVGVTHRMEADGSRVRLLSANYLNDFTPYVLADGRIIYSRWEYVDKPAIPIQSLWTINPDGTGLSMYFGNGVISPGTFMEPRPIPGTHKIVCVMTGHNGPTRGALGVIDRTKGVNAQAAIENITPDVAVPPVDQGNGNTGGTKQYSNPLPLDGERLLVSIQGPLLARTFDGACQSLALPAPDDGMQWFAAQPIRPRPRPPVIPSTLKSAGDGFVDERWWEPGHEAVEYATVYVQDVYRGLEDYVTRGEIAAIRVVQEIEKSRVAQVQYRAFGFQFPVVSCGATYAPKQVWGSVPVEPDGSAYFRIPANRPLYFMVLDAEGRAIQRMRSFTHLMPGEVQGCVGCHESRLETGTMTQRRLALERAPRELTPPEWGVTGFSYARIVQPVWDQYCVSCHHADAAPGGVDLSGDRTDFFNVSYETLARRGSLSANWAAMDGSPPPPDEPAPLAKWIPTYNGQEQNILEVRPRFWGSPASRLTELIMTGHPDGEGRPRVAMDATARRGVFAWIDLNVPYYGTSLSNHYDRHGCRRMVPEGFDALIQEVADRRCGGCHGADANGHARIPRDFWLRIDNPQHNRFLKAPLARSAGGTEQCGQPVFANTDDPDYQKLIESFRPIQKLLIDRPRLDG